MDLTLLEDLPIVAFGPNEDVISEGQPITGMYFLIEGEVEVFKEGELIAEDYERGAMFGDIAFLLGKLPMATVRTVTASRFRYVSDPRGFFSTHPTVALHMASILARRLDSMGRYLVDIKLQFRDRSDHLGMIDQVLDTLMHKQPRVIPRRPTGD